MGNGQGQNKNNIDDPLKKLSESRVPLSDEQRRRLEDMSEQIKKKAASNSKFFKFFAGDTKTILCDPDKIKTVEMTFPNKPGEPENKPTTRMLLMIKIANANGVVPENAEEVEWNTSETTGNEVLRWVLMGFRLLDVHREGSGKKDTKFTISPHL